MQKGHRKHNLTTGQAGIGNSRGLALFSVLFSVS